MPHHSVKNKDSYTEMSTSALSVRDLNVRFRGGRRDPVVNAVKGVSFDLGHNETLAVVGESGSGKSVMVKAVLGLLANTAEQTGSVYIDGVAFDPLNPVERQKQLVANISIILQDPVGALNPVLTIRRQLAESIRTAHPGLSFRAVHERAVKLLNEVELWDVDKFLKSYPHQLSGGQCQRIGIAMALAKEPRILVADEPTTALDVTVQAGILTLLRKIRQSSPISVLFITHDMGVVANVADRVVVMKNGEVLETQDVFTLFRTPQHEYTKSLLSAVPLLSKNGSQKRSIRHEESRAAVVEASDISIEYRGKVGAKFLAVDRFSLRFGAGEIVGLVGESGSGKSSILRAISGSQPISTGEIRVLGNDLSALSRRRRRDVLSNIGVVFQNPLDSMNPRMNIAQNVGELLYVHQRIKGQALSQAVKELFGRVKLDEKLMKRYPSDLSGGQLQRAAIARAISLNPKLLFADEPTSALDVVVQADILELFQELQSELNFGCLFVSHDLAVVDRLCDRVVVLQHGTIVEDGPTSSVLHSPNEDYTKKLLSSILVADPTQAAR